MRTPGFPGSTLRERFVEGIERDDRAPGIPAAGRGDGPRSTGRIAPESWSIAASSFRGMVGVERQVGPARLQDAQETDHSRRPPVEVEAHDGLRLHAQLDRGDGPANWITDLIRGM